MKKHLLKKAALVALTVTTVAATSGVADASNSLPVPVKKVAQGDDNGGNWPMMSRAGIRW